MNDVEHDPDTQPGRPPSEQWWVLNGEVLREIMRRAAAGEDLDLLYLEYYSQCEHEDEDGAE